MMDRTSGIRALQEEDPDVADWIRQNKDRAQRDINFVAESSDWKAEEWIERAKAIQKDIEKSRALAKDIRRHAQKTGVLRSNCEDASQKKQLLEKDIRFNEELQDVFRKIQQLHCSLNTANEDAQAGKLEKSYQSSLQLERSLRLLPSAQGSTFARLLQSRIDTLRGWITEKAKEMWSSSIQVVPESRELQISDSHGESGELDIEQLAKLLTSLGVLDEAIGELASKLEQSITSPLIDSTRTSKPFKVAIDAEHSSLKLVDDDSSRNMNASMDGVYSFLSFLHSRLPKSVSSPLAESLMPKIIQKLLLAMTFSISPDLTELSTFQSLLSRASQFSSQLKSFEWEGSADVDEWVEQAPVNWLARRRETCIIRVKELLATRLREVREVEHVETQVVPQRAQDSTEPAGGSAAGDDDWDSQWDDPPTAGSITKLNSDGQKNTNDEDDDEFSAWDTGEEAAATRTESSGDAVESTEKEHEAEKRDEEDEDAWGWGDDDQSNAPSSPKMSRKEAPPTDEKPSQAQTITLREVYKVSGIPDELIEIIIRVAADAAALTQENYRDSPIAAATNAMYSIPTQALASYRALAPTFYQSITGGNMFLYNDSMRLAQQLSSFRDRQVELDEQTGLSKTRWASSKMKLDNDIEALHGFGRRAYSKEMESQRTIMRDLLDGAQGFVNCTQPPFSAECETAISSVVERIRALNKEWAGILSHSALLQSIGSMLSTVVNKLIIDIEDLSDIGEKQSVRLHEFCEEIIKLRDIFTQTGPDGNEGDTTGIYTPGWFKFQHLSEILIAKLVDIKYFWSEGDLKLDYDGDELVDLVKALFSDSDHRRRAIAEIKRG